MTEKSIQETYAPNNACFGCGPANEKGLHIRSFPQGDEVVATFHPETYQEAFPGMLSGGIIGTLLDCHCNWAGAYHLMKQAGLDHPPCTVTADYAIKLLRPTPTDQPIELRARVVESTEDRAIVEGELIAHGKSLRDLPRDFRGGEARPSGLSSLVERLWSAPAERSGDGALAGLRWCSRKANPKRCRATTTPARLPRRGPRCLAPHSKSHLTTIFVFFCSRSTAT